MKLQHGLILLLLASNALVRPETVDTEVALSAAAPQQLEKTVEIEAAYKTLLDKAVQVQDFDGLVKGVLQTKDAELLLVLEQYFFKDFDVLLSNFLPCAKSLCTQVFPLMAAKDIGQATKKLVDVVALWPWWYYQNNKAQVNDTKLRFLIEECTFLITRIEATYVNPSSGKIVDVTKKTANKKPVPKSKNGKQKINGARNQMFMQVVAHENAMSLVAYWQQNFVDNPYHMMLACLQDLLFVQMYSNIMSVAVKRKNVGEFRRVRNTIQMWLSRLRGTRFERGYTKALQLAINLDSYLEELLLQALRREHPEMWEQR